MLSKSKLNDLRNNFSLDLEGLRILNCYDCEGISEQDFERCKSTVFSEPPVDVVYDRFDEINIGNDATVFMVKYLPGQFDQRADSAVQCIQAVTGTDGCIVETARLYIINGNLSETDIKTVKSYFINPVESCEVGLEPPERLGIVQTEVADIEEIPLINLDENAVKDLHSRLGLAMSVNDLLHCQAYFKSENRDPTETEIRVLDTYWSDHCRHTTFSTELTDISFEDGRYKPLFEEAYKLFTDGLDELGKNKKTLMSLATLGMRILRKNGYLDDLDESDEINACSINVTVDVDGQDEEYVLMFKNETHNHPTEIEPFGGAATCLGGAIRDPLSGRTYVYQAMRVTGSANPHSKTALEGKLLQRKITVTAAEGFSSYGNQIGLATGMVREVYHEGYVAKRMEIGAVLGAAKRSHIYRDKPQPGDVVIMVGGRTGRDGCGGATGSSKGHDISSLKECGAEVQKGNAPTERKLQRLFRNPEVSKLIKRCNDFGAGGVSVAVGELADGILIDLDRVPKKYEGLNGTHIAISESQERMAVVVEKDHAETFIRLSREENLEACVIAEVTEEERVVMNWRGKQIVNLSRAFLDTNGAPAYAKVLVKCPESLENVPVNPLNVCGQKGLSERFDSTIGANTVLMPFGGKYQLTPVEAMAAKLPTNGETNTVSLMSYGFNPDLSERSPFHGALYAVVESVSKLVATGGDYEGARLSLQEYFEKPKDEPTRWGKPFAALLGAFYAQMMLKLPAIGGKDSMSGSFMDLDVPPTLVSFAAGVTKLQKVCSPEFKSVGSNIFSIMPELTAYDIPNFESLTNIFKAITKLIQGGHVLAVRSVAQGGVKTALTEMCIGNGIGIKAQSIKSTFAGGFIIETSLDASVLKAQTGLDWMLLGVTTDKDFELDGQTTPITTLTNAWLEPLEAIFPTRLMREQSAMPQINITHSKPTVFMPIFPGTNCEYDMTRAFEKAGANVKTLVIKNLTTNELNDCIKETARLIDSAQIIAFPGGFSAGDEPEGSGKFIAAIFRNPLIKEAVQRHLDDGLILGICNGFQALVKLGLLPNPHSYSIDVNSPTLTFNEIGRHISCIVETKVLRTNTPWLNMAQKDVPYSVAVSHGEGRFFASDAVCESLFQNRQVATQYVDFNLNPSMDIRFNPNGSSYAIEGIMSKDGKVLGKMGHTERFSDGIYKNYNGNFNLPIFESGVRYFGL